MNSNIQLLAPNHSLENRVNDYMRPFHTASCQEHLIGALQQLPRSPDFPNEESSIREQVALRLLQEVIVMGAQEQEALDACLVACGPLEALSACASTLQEITARNNGSSKSKKKKKRASKNTTVDSPSILETALRTIRRWLVKGVSFPPDCDDSEQHYYEERCWVETVTASMTHHSASACNSSNNNPSSPNSNNRHDDDDAIKDIHSPLVQACLESLTKLVLLFPVQIANACHALHVQLPSWAIASRYNPRLIEGALSMAIYQQEREDVSYSALYFKMLVQHMVRSRNPDDVAVGLYKYHERHFRNNKDNSNNINSAHTTRIQPKALCQLLLELHRHTLSPRESAYLLRSIMISSIPRQSHATKIAAAQLAELWQRHLYPYMELSCRPILVASRKVREAFVRLLVLSPSSVLTEEWPDRLLCHCVASLLANPESPDNIKNNNAKPKSSDKTRSTRDSDSTSSSSSSSSDSGDEDDDSDSDSSDDDGSTSPQNEVVQHHAWLARHVQEVITTWSLSVFVRQTDYRLQRHVTNFLLSGISFLHLQNSPSSVVGGSGSAKEAGGPPTSDLVSGLLEGVTVRLESSTPEIRKDGMMIAERLAQKMGQELQFEELEQERTLAAEDDEVTFLQSVMTASDLPTYYPKPTFLNRPPPHPKKSTGRQDQEQEQRSRKLNSTKNEKISAKRREKEERRKRRKAKQEGASDTRILDAVYGHMKSSSQKQTTSRRKPSCQDSYEESYDAFGAGPDQATTYHPPPMVAPQQSRSGLHGTLQTYQEPPLPIQSYQPINRRLAPLQQTRPKYDSFDNSSVQQEESQPIVNEGNNPCKYQAQAPLMDPAKYGEVAHGIHAFSQEHYQHQQQQQPQTRQPHPSKPSSVPPQTNYRGYAQEPIVLHDGFNESGPPQRGHNYRRQESAHAQRREANFHQDVRHHDQYQQPQYAEEPQYVDKEPSLPNDGEEQRVTFNNHDYVIPEPESIKKDLYWQQQLKQQRRQKQFEQRQAVEYQLQKQHEQQKKWKQQHKDLKTQATLRIASPTSPPPPASDTEDDEQQEFSPSGRQPKQFVDADSGEEEADEEDPGEEEYSKRGFRRFGQEEKDSDDEEEEDGDGDGIAACWTQNEVEMVLENDLPQHSGSSPRHVVRSPRRASSPRKAQGKPRSPRKTSNPQPIHQNKTESRSFGGGKDVPTLIFAMVEDGRSESSDRDTNLEKEKIVNREEESINDMAIKKLQHAGSPRSNTPQPHKDKRHESKSWHRIRKEQHNSSAQESNQKSSLVSVRDRKHPQVDPAEIEDRILAAAFDHESAASTTSAPSLSVYSSGSSDYSLYLGGGRRRDETSHQRVIRKQKQLPYANEYEAKKEQQRQQKGDDPKHRSCILLNGRTPKSPNKRVLMVDPDAEYVSEDEDEEEDGDFEDDDESEDDDCSRTLDDDDGEERSSEEGSYSDEEESDDEDSDWDEESEHRHLDAYDVDDDEEDLMETPTPLYLRDCLELLRTPETDDHARSKQETALKYLPRLVQGKDKPADLPDLAVPLALELMRMEDKCNIANFSDSKLISSIALTVEEPLGVGQRLVLLLWEDIAFMDRLDVLTVLSEAAFELSGNQELEEWNKSTVKDKIDNRNKQVGSRGKRAYVKENYSLLSCKDNSTLETGTDMGSIVSVHGERALGNVESKTRRWGRGIKRQDATHTIRSRFGPVAHVWYYSLVGGFLQRKDNPALWGGNIGARLLANMFVTLATIVECAGVSPGTEVLAKDLLELVWSFRTVDVAEVRMGVLVAVAASLSCLSEEVVLTMMFDGQMSSLPEGLKQMSQLDPDESCRRLASSMAKGIGGIVDSLQPVGKISELSLINI